MKKIPTILCFKLSLFLFLVPLNVFAQIIFTEDFESGTANALWGNFYALDGVPEETVIAVPMANAPQPLTGSGNYVGLLQDINGSYTGAALATAGAVSLKDYSIEADVYCYVNNLGGSAYSGLVVYADSSKKDAYKMRVDFDASNRINFSDVILDPATFTPKYNYNFGGAANPGLYPTTDGWHKLKVEVRTINDTTVRFWCYFDNQMLTNSPIESNLAGGNTAGSFGLYSLQQSTTGLAAYFDNIVVKQLQPVTSVEDNDNPNIPKDLYLYQNYPNPFNPTTNISYKLKDAQNVSLIIYDVLGEKVKTLVSQFQSPGNYTVTWNGQNDSGNKVKSGIYIYTLKSSDVFVSKKMLMLK